MTLNTFHNWLLYLAGCLMLSACSMQPVRTIDDSDKHLLWQAHRLEVSKITDWKLSGKLGLRSPAESGSARLNWTQHGPQFSIYLSGPFGQGSATLSGTTQGVTLQMAGHDPYHTRNPDTILNQQLGWDVPIAALFHWVRGLPVPESDAQFELDERGLITRLKQASWSIIYQGYQPFNTFLLPRKIKLQRGDVKLTLVITQWSDNPLNNS